MKTKKISNKLRLNKKTIANLNSRDMNRLKGGDETTKFTCYTECCTDYISCGEETCRTCVSLCGTCLCSQVTCTGDPCCM